MKELNKIEKFGYITQGLDLTIRARTINNEIICLDVTPEGTTGKSKGEHIELPEEMAKTDRIVDIIHLLKRSKLEIINKKIIITPYNKTNDNAQRDCLIDNCGIDVCTNHTCIPYVGASSTPDVENKCIADGQVIFSQKQETYCPFVL